MDNQYPWEEPPLDNWFVVCLNHYVRDGEKRLFCAMQRRGRLIEARGDSLSVFTSLKKQARAWNEISQQL